MKCNRCGNLIAKEEKNSCANCLTKAKESAASARERRHSQGLCIYCGQTNALPEKKYCPSCKKKDRARKGKLKEKRKNLGLCSQCGNRPPEPNEMRCSECGRKDRTRRKKIMNAKKKRAVIHKGGKCQDCGLMTEHLPVYEFHHIANDKDRSISSMMKIRLTWDELQIELDKCIMLCANCHRIRHSIDDENGDH